MPGVLQLMFRALKFLNVFEKFDRLLVLVFGEPSYIRVSAQCKYRSRTVYTCIGDKCIYRAQYYGPY